MLNRGVSVTGSKSELARRVGVLGPNMRKAFSGERGLPDDACVELAELINVDPFTVIAARNEALAKTEEARSFWHRFSQAAAVTATVIGVTFFVSHSPEAVAAQGNTGHLPSNYTLLTLREMVKAWLSRQKAALARSSRAALPWRLRLQGS